MAKEKVDLTYEEAEKELKEILDELENSDISLEKSQELFVRGNLLYKHCEELLNKVEGEIKVLFEKEEPVEQSFLGEED